MAETIPPLLEGDLEAALLNPSFSTYLYIGEEADLGWDNAMTAFSLIPRLRIYLVKDASQIKKWIGSKRPAGVVFGWGDKFDCLLNQSEADDLKTVIDAITEARKK